MRAEYAGAAAGGLLGAPRVRGAVGAQEKTRIAARHDREQGLAVRFALEHGQAEMMRADSAVKKRIAIKQKMMWGNRGGDAGPRVADELDRRARSHMFEYHAQPGPSRHQRRQD